MALWRCNLPAEIWDTVLKLCRRHQIRRLSLVSGQFRSLCLPLLLRDQSFAHEVISHQDLERAVVRFDELSQEAFSQHVRSWHCAFPDNTQDLTAQVIDAFLTKIGAFRKLTSLRINLVIVDRVLIDILKDLPLLEDLALDDCSIECREASMNLLSLELSGHDIHAASPLQLASSRNLQILRVGAEMDPRALIDGFGDDDELSIKLRDLAVDDLSAAFVDRFFAFLQRCPQLECLEIGNCPRPLATRINLSAPTYLRSLRAVKAPPEVVQLLIPHRLLSVVAFQREAPGSFELLEIQRACHLFRESAAALETLSITRVRATLPFLVALIPLFPNLRELSISWMGFISTGPGWSPPDLPLHNTDDDELSDPEEDVPIDVVSSAWASKPSILHEIIRWILQRQVTLPQNIEIFRLPTYGMLTTPVQKEEQCKAIAGLAHMSGSVAGTAGSPPPVFSPVHRPGRRRRRLLVRRFAPHSLAPPPPTPVQKEEQCKAIAGLVHMYASLREIQLTDKVWQRCGDCWVSAKDPWRIKVV
ncbi:hypothetical protein B0H11DRAFT_2208617 [Mycena galericulata]|nr:hypothetical protein B0H11DRAFT_2208617 [Mycena galericulata]